MLVPKMFVKSCKIECFAGFCKDHAEICNVLDRSLFHMSIHSLSFNVLSVYRYTSKLRFSLILCSFLDHYIIFTERRNYCCMFRYSAPLVCELGLWKFWDKKSRCQVVAL